MLAFAACMQGDIESTPTTSSMSIPFAADDLRHPSLRSRRGLASGSIGVVLLGLATSCSRTDPAVERAAWHEYLASNAAQLRRMPSPIPVPTAKLPGRLWKAYRLDEMLDRATLEPNLRRPATVAHELLSLGPLQCGRPDPHLTCERDGDGVHVVLHGFDLARESIGVVEITLPRPSGESFDLWWGKGGKVRVPVDATAEVTTYGIRTTGFVEWSGALQELHLRILAEAEAPIVLRRVRLLPLEQLYARPIGVQRVKVNRQIRDAIYMHTPGTIRLPPLEVPPSGKLAVSVAATAAQGKRAGDSRPATRVTFDAFVEEARGAAPLLHLEPAAPEDWTGATASLAPWAGRSVRIVLTVSSSTPGAVAFWGSPIVYQPVESPPTTVVYLIDALSARHVGLYGYGRPTMPNLEGLASHGVWFKNMFANASRTVEAVATLVHGIYPRQHGVTTRFGSSTTKLASVARELQAAGFATALFSTNVNAGPHRNTDQGFDVFTDRVAYWWTEGADRTVPIEAVRTWLQENVDRPVFMYIHTAEPHDPYTPPLPYLGRYGGRRRDAPVGYREHFIGLQQPAAIARVVTLYDEEVAYADARLGEAVRVVEALRGTDRTQWFVTADHGEEFGEHGFWTHGNSLFEPIIRVPLIVCGPGIARRGRQDAPAQTADLMPTILELARLQPPYPLAGRSLAELLRGGAGGSEWMQRVLIASSHSKEVTEYSLVEGARWKLVLQSPGAGRKQAAPDGEFALFDVERDPAERDSLIDTHQDVARRLVGTLLRWHRETPPFVKPGGSATGEMDVEQLEALRALGYVK